MEIIQIEDMTKTEVKPHKPTAHEQNQAHSVFLAKELMGNLLKQGLITKDEYEKIMARNRASFLPNIASLYDE